MNERKIEITQQRTFGRRLMTQKTVQKIRETGKVVLLNIVPD